LPDLHPLLTLASTEQISDLLLMAGTQPVLRYHDRLERVESPRLTPGDTEAMLNQLLNEAQRERYERCGEITFSHSVFGSGRYRVSAYRQRGTTCLVIRAIPATVPTAVQLRLPDAVLHMVLAQGGGLVVVSSPPGGGRTTTLAALVDTVNSQRQCHILTIESPIEHLHRHSLSVVTQREVPGDTETIACGLSSAGNQAADVIILSELDAASTPMALGIAASGKLVLAATVAPSIAESLAILVIQLPAHVQSNARRQLATCLRGAICGQLVPSAGDSGRVAAFEVLTPGPTARGLIGSADWTGLAKLIDDGIEPGTTGMRQSLATLAAMGEISEAEYLARAGALGDPMG